MFKVSQDIQLNSNTPNQLSNIRPSNNVKWSGTGLQHITLNSKNEFTIDASNAGDNIMFVGIYGPQGQCEEVSIRHMGNHIYKICYQIKDPGMYVIVAKWGEDHIPGSPFNLIA